MEAINIVIPVHNQARKLIECLKSIQKQTFQDFSIIIIDDGSTDDFKTAVESWLRKENLQAKDPSREISTKTKIFVQKRLGPNAARNRGAKECLGEYILFCDADIVLHKNFLEKTYTKLKNQKEASYCYTSFKYGWKKFKLFPFDAQKLKEMPYIHTTSLIRRKDFHGFDENIKRLQDWDMWLTMLEKGFVGVWIPEVLFKVKSGGSISRWVPKFFIKHFKNSKKVKAYWEAIGIIKKKHKILTYEK